MNDAGYITGWSHSVNGNSKAVIWGPDGSVKVIQENSDARGINDKGQVVGGIDSVPVVWNPDGTVVKLAAMGLVYAINDKGWVVGSTYSESQGQHATLWLPSGEQVKVDIKPGDNANVINMKSKGTTPVAILGDEEFDAATVDPATVVLAGASVKIKPNGKLMASCEDVNGDGCMDMVLHFPTQSFVLSSGNTKASLEGKTADGTEIEGEDAVNVL